MIFGLKVTEKNNYLQNIFAIFKIRLAKCELLWYNICHTQDKFCNFFYKNCTLNQASRILPIKEGN